MNPCQLNAAIAAITNHLYGRLKRDDFINLGILLSMLSKDILSMAAFEGILDWENGKPRQHKKDNPPCEKAEKKND